MPVSVTRRELLAAPVLAGALAIIPRAFAQGSAATLVAAMKTGGTVIFLRHAATHQEQIDTGRLGDRAGQRNLSPAGIAQARELGRAFAALGIVLDPILASPVFRARDTAELAFGAARVQVSMAIVADDYTSDVNAMITASRQLLRTPPAAGKNVLLVGHRRPLELVTERQFPDTIMPEGAMAVFAPGGTEARLLGTMKSDELSAAAGLRQ